MNPRNAFLLLFFGVTAVLLGSRAFERILLAMSVVSQSTEDVLENSSHSLTYATDKTRWLRFDLPRDHTSVKLVVNATCTANAVLRPFEDLRFALRCRMETEDGGWKEQDYHFRTRVAERVIGEDGSVSDRLFLLDSGERACDGRTVLIDEMGTRREKQIQIRLLQKDARVSDVLIRLYSERLLSTAQRHFRWQRMGRAKRERLTRWNVYPPDLLTEDEKLRYSAAEWQATAPWGVVGKDFRMRLLYRRSEEDSNSDPESGHSSGLEVGPGRRGTIALPDGRNLVKLRIRNRDPYDEPHNEEIILRLFGRDLDDRSRRVLQIDGRETVWTGWFEGGLLDVESEWAVSIQALLGEEEADVTPEERFVRTYVCEPGDPVDFDVAHMGDEPSSSRVDFRVFGLKEELQGFDEAQVRCEMLDADGIVIEESVAFVPTEASVYESVVAVDERIRVGEKSSLYFSLPREVARIRVHAVDEAVLVCTFNRPPGFPKEIRLPEDYFAFNRSKSRSRGWFVCRPTDFVDRISLGTTRVVSVQFRPPDLDDLVLAGRYDRTSYSPEGAWAGRPILLHGEVDRLVARGLGGSVYSELAGGSDHVVEVIGPEAVQEVELRVVFPGDGLDAPVQIDIDGESRLALPDTPTRTVFSLGKCFLGYHVIRVHAPSTVRVLVSRVVAPAGRHFIRHIGAAFEQRSLVYRYEKVSASKEVLVARFFRTDAGSQRASICAEIFGLERDGRKVTDDWTFSKRRFDIQASPRGGAVVIGADWEQVQDPQKLVVPLRADMPPGEYEVVFSLEGGVSGYLTVSRIIGGDVDEYRFFSE